MDYNELSDAELVSHIKHDNRIAFECIYRRHASDLVRYLSEKVNTKDDCEEILTNVFVGLWFDRHSVEDNLTADLYAFLRFRLVRYIQDNPSSSLFKHLKQSYYETR